MEADSRSTKRFILFWFATVVLLLIIGLLCWQLISSRNERKAEVTLREERIDVLQNTVDNNNAVIEELKGKIDGLIASSNPVITESLLSEQLNAVRELITEEYVYTNACAFADNKSITIIFKEVDIPFTRKQFIVLYDGRIKAGIDLSMVRISVTEAPRTIAITLPKSKILSHEIFEDSLHVLDESNNALNPIKINEFSQVISQEKTKMEEHAIQLGLLTDADERAREVIQSFLGRMPGIAAYKVTIN